MILQCCCCFMAIIVVNGFVNVPSKCYYNSLNPSSESREDLKDSASKQKNYHIRPSTFVIRLRQKKDGDENENEEEELYDVDGLGSIFSSGNDDKNEELLIFPSDTFAPSEQDTSSSRSEDKGSSEAIITNTKVDDSNYDDDLSGCSFRRFRLGEDMTITNYIGSLGFEEITDWNYYETTYDGRTEIERRKVEANPLDPNQPKRTRQKSGSLIRVFVGKLVGPLSAQLRSRGFDDRLLIKEFQDSQLNERMKDLATKEVISMAKVQSHLIQNHGSNDANDGLWTAQALDRTMGDRSSDNKNMIDFVELFNTQTVPYVSLLGELDLEDDLETIDKNDWYRAFGVTSPQKGSKWLIYEYCGLQTLRRYAVPPQLRVERSPPAPRRGGGGFFGSLFSSSPSGTGNQIPPYRERVNYVINGIMYQCLGGLAEIHEAGLIHGSIGLESIILSSKTFDKLETSQVSSTNISKLRIVYSDFGFGRSLADTVSDDNFLYRAKGYGLSNPKGLQATSFAIAEDLYALGFVFLGLLLTVLADVSQESAKGGPGGFKQMPPTGEDQLQRLLSEIFNNDFDEFRNYCENEDVWTKVVEVLDEHDQAGWTLLKDLCLSRETAVENSKTSSSSFQMLTARGLLESSQLFDVNRQRRNR